MFKNFRKTLNDRIGYALAGLDWKDRPTPKRRAEVELSLNGLFDPIFERYIAIERRAPSTLRTMIDEVLHKAGCLTPTHSSMLNLNLAIYSILLILHAGKNAGDDEINEDILDAVEREWGLALRKSGAIGVKAALTEQLGNPTDLEVFLIHHGNPDKYTPVDELYYARSRVLGFLLSLRTETFVELTTSGGDQDGTFLWNWAFGKTMDKQLLRLSGEMFHLMIALGQDTLTLYGIDSGPAVPEEIILPCPNCSKRLRLTLPPKAMAGRCRACKHPFSVVIEPHQIYLAAIPVPVGGFSDDERVIRALQTLGVKGRVGPAEIRTAYRKRMSEYHPDKVNSLGPKIRALAEEETKEINTALEILRRAGYLSE
jgi:hypothetical protein